MGGSAWGAAQNRRRSISLRVPALLPTEQDYVNLVVSTWYSAEEILIIQILTGWGRAPHVQLCDPADCRSASWRFVQIRARDGCQRVACAGPPHRALPTTAAAAWLERGQRPVATLLEASCVRGLDQSTRIFEAVRYTRSKPSRPAGLARSRRFD